MRNALQIFSGVRFIFLYRSVFDCNSFLDDTMDPYTAALNHLNR